jgi:hypothetical protein
VSLDQCSVSATTIFAVDAEERRVCGREFSANGKIPRPFPGHVSGALRFCDRRGPWISSHIYYPSTVLRIWRLFFLQSAPGAAFLSTPRGVRLAPSDGQVPLRAQQSCTDGRDGTLALSVTRGWQCWSWTVRDALDTVHAARRVGFGRVVLVLGAPVCVPQSLSVAAWQI